MLFESSCSEILNRGNIYNIEAKKQYIFLSVYILIIKWLTDGNADPGFVQTVKVQVTDTSLAGTAAFIYIISLCMERRL